MFWLQLTLQTDPESAQQLSNILNQFGANSVSLSAAGDEKIFTPAEQATDLWQRTQLTALLHKDTDLDTLLVCLYTSVGNNKINKPKIELLKDRDWVDEFRSGHTTKIFSDRLCICPSWCELPKNNMATVQIDPGMAFGTGSHETTATCLTWLAQNDIRGKSVIDYGCGSGILALAAVKLGAKKVYAIDIDQQALQVSEENARKNKISDKLKIAHPDDIELPAVDILIANILLNPLQKLAQRFAGLVRPAGDLVLSGLLAHQSEDCLDTYKTWFNMKPPIFKQEWAFLHGVKK